MQTVGCLYSFLLHIQILAQVNVLKYNFWSEEQIPKPVFISAGDFMALIARWLWLHSMLWQLSHGNCLHFPWAKRMKMIRAYLA